MLFLQHVFSLLNRVTNGNDDISSENHLETLKNMRGSHFFELLIFVQKFELYSRDTVPLKEISATADCRSQCSSHLLMQEFSTLRCFHILEYIRVFSSKIRKNNIRLVCWAGCLLSPNIVYNGEYIFWL
jgi:hypothetical protein